MTEDEMIEGIFPEPPPERRKRSAGGFRPWHLPRKQAIRWEHLHNLVIRAHKNKSIDRKDEIKYLGLPGSEFLDIRSILGMESAKLGGYSPTIYFVGFDTTAAIGSEGSGLDLVGEVDIKANERVGDSSRIIRDDFSHLGYVDSVSRKQVDDYGPYDVVNLDFCDSILSDEIDDTPSVYAAIEQLFSVQRGAVKGWGLVVTTRLDQGGISETAAVKMLEILQASDDSEMDFAPTMKNVLGMQVADCLEEDGEDYRSGLMVALLTWLSGVGVREGFTVTMLDPYSYSVVAPSDTEAVDDMASLAFFFERDDDPVAVFPSVPPGDGPDRRSTIYANKATEAVGRIIRIDKILAMPQKEIYLNACIEESRRLLSAAGIDVTSYEEWARLTCQAAK